MLVNLLDPTSTGWRIGLGRDVELSERRPRLLLVSTDLSLDWLSLNLIFVKSSVDQQILRLVAWARLQTLSRLLHLGNIADPLLLDCHSL